MSGGTGPEKVHPARPGVPQHFGGRFVLLCTKSVTLCQAVSPKVLRSSGVRALRRPCHAASVRRVEHRHIQTFRQFQRVVSREIGMYEEDFLGRGRTLGASRLLWEMGDAPVEVATLRTRLGLDPAYASRLIASLEAEGLVTLAPSPSDARAKVVVRTPEGTKEVATLDTLADAAAAGRLAHLDDAELAKVEDAARTITRALMKRHIKVQVEDPESRDAQWCVGEYVAELQATFETGYDPAKAVTVTGGDLRAPHGAFVIARLHGQVVGCGGVKLTPGEPAFLKRMWVAPEARGLGVAGVVLTHLEGIAREAGATQVRLDTNSKLGPAARLYESRGYREVPDFNGEPHADRWYAREL